MSANRLAVTLGDPRGIGPEIVRKALLSLPVRGTPSPVVLIGPEGYDPEVAPYESVGSFDGSEASAGATSALAVERAVSLALEGSVSGIVTGPIHKPALRAAGYSDPGHTEMLQRLAGVPNVGMLMAAEETAVGGPLRVLLATTHVALRSVPDLVSIEVLVTQTTLLSRALEHDWGIAAPRLGLCALNPHASDRGLFGDEEAVVFLPAIEKLREANIDVQGPLPADTVFGRALRGEFDAVVAPYHDVGMAAFKTVAFGRGVNVTLGLPFVRTSPDHGTAFDLVGTGRADPSSMEEAIRLATLIAQNRFDTLAAQA
jgi:4-hydroxythreonine-4-phosphate dehydrogenase